jgi:hypothetical protein
LVEVPVAGVAAAERPRHIGAEQQHTNASGKCECAASRATPGPRAQTGPHL